MYLITLVATPTAGAAQATDIAGAEVLVAVDLEDRAAAEATARALIMQDGWIVVEVEQIMQIEQAQIADFDEDIKALCRQALVDGTAALYVAWPRDVRDDDAGVELRSLPKSSSGPEH